MKKKTVTVGIPAHNEEKNIARLIAGILSQKGNNFVLESVVIVCDGCTDNTASIVRGIAQKNKLVKCFDDGRRTGQAQRLNELYKTLESDIFITFDADVQTAHASVIQSMVSAFDDPAVGLVGGCEIPVKQTTFVGKSLDAYQTHWRHMIGGVNGGNNIHRHPGCISAGSRAFLKTVSIPKHISANDHFLFFDAIKKGFSFKFAPGALIYFKVPSTLSDFIKQSVRFHRSSEDIRDYFGDWVDEYYSIPLRVKLLSYVKTFFETPLYLTSSLVLQVILKVSEFTYKDPTKNGIWSTVQSSK